MNVVKSEAEKRAQTTSKENQAKLNSAEWLRNYKQMVSEVNPEVSPLNMSNQVNVALADPVYGQMQAAGLTAGQNMINSWIAGVNARTRKKKEELANERWIRQMDMDEEDKQYNRRMAKEDRDFRRKELEEAKKTVVDAVPYQLDAFKEKIIKSNPEMMKAYNDVTTPYEAKNAFEASKHKAEQARKIGFLNAAQESLNPILTSLPAKGEDIERSDSFMDYIRKGVDSIPGIRRMVLSPKERAYAKLADEMRKENATRFYEISPETLRMEAARSNMEGLSNTAGQQNKIAELVERYMQLHPKAIVKQSAGNDIIVVASPDDKPLVITPNSVDRLAEQFNIR